MSLKPTLELGFLVLSDSRRGLVDLGVCLLLVYFSGRVSALMTGIYQAECN